MAKETVAIVGAGVIGSSYAAWFAAKGYTVRIYDPKENYEKTLREHLATAIGEIPGGNVDEGMGRVSIVSSLEEAVKGADMVQESGLETVDFKQSIFAELEKLCGPDTLLASSSSGITPDVIGAKMNSPERALIGHPFNPPHVLPITEVCSAPNAPDELVQRLLDFYEASERVAARLNKPIDGFVTNRLQYVFIEEAVNLVEQGVVDVENLDKIVMASLGTRWASVGPFLAGQLGGGPGGVKGILENIFGRLATAMGLRQISPETIAMLQEQCGRIYPLEHSGDFAAARDKRQIDVLAAQKKHPLPKFD